MPTIRNEFAHFVELWNNHRIRSQPRRPHVIAGRPYQLFHLPEDDRQDFRVPVDPSTLAYIKEILQQDTFDIDEYLPSATMQFCNQALTSLGGLPEWKCEGERAQPWLEQYIALRDILHRHIISEANPRLSLVPHPTLDNESATAFLQRLELKLQDLQLCDADDQGGESVNADEGDELDVNLGNLAMQSNEE